MQCSLASVDCRVGKQQAAEQLQLLVSAFSDTQQDQYEIFRRSTFSKSCIR